MVSPHNHRNPYGGAHRQRKHRSILWGAFYVIFPLKFAELNWLTRFYSAHIHSTPPERDREREIERIPKCCEYFFYTRSEWNSIRGVNQRGKMHGWLRRNVHWHIRITICEYRWKCLSFSIKTFICCASLPCPIEKMMTLIVEQRIHGNRCRPYKIPWIVVNIERRQRTLDKKKFCNRVT